MWDPVFRFSSVLPISVRSIVRVFGLVMNSLVSSTTRGRLLGGLQDYKARRLTSQYMRDCIALYNITSIFRYKGRLLYIRLPPFLN